MGNISKIFGKSSKVPKPKFLRKENQGKNTYELYKGKDAESARQFLETKKANQQLYYIVVETPEGNWGVDIQGLYLERLLPWQINTKTGDCIGHIIPMSWSKFGLELAAKKINDNFIVKVECGSCQNQWLDGVRYQNTTIVRCHKCKKLNQVNSGNINVILI